MGDLTSPQVPDYRTLFEAAPGLFLVLRPDLTIAAVSDAYLHATMTARDEILGRDVFEVFPDNPDDPAASGASNLRSSLDRVRTALVADTMAIQKYDIRRPESQGGGFEERYWSPVNSPVLGADGHLAYIIHRVEDVTEFVHLRRHRVRQQRLTAELRARIEASEAEVLGRAREIAEANRELERVNADLRRSGSFLDSVIENIPDMIFVKDVRDLRFVRLNRAGEELLGYAEEDLIGKSDFDVFPPEEAESFVAKDREVIEARRLVDIPEEAVATAHQGRRILHTKKIPILDDEGRPAFLIGISEDITERKQAEDELRAARAAAEAANLAKSEFLSRMSHELRTPLNAILGFAQLLELDPLEPDQLDSVRYISRAGRHLLDLINDVLDISRIESGNMTISPEPVAVDELVGELLAFVRPLAASRGVLLDASDAACDSHVHADRQRLGQVLLNLLSNAVKYNRDGGTVAVRCHPAEAGRLRIEVVDTGFGIAPERLARLFRPFDRLGAEHGTVEGTGMGLALAKGLVEAMGGSIGAASTLDVGSTFWVELAPVEGPMERYERTRATSRPERPAAAGMPRIVLQIEDNHSNLRLVERIITLRPDFGLITAMQGRRGVELARERRPDLILLDLHLPDQPGHETLHDLKTHPETRDIPVVIVSADATRTQVARLIDAGASGYLTKPLDVAEFLRVLDRTVGADAGGAAS